MAITDAVLVNEDSDLEIALFAAAKVGMALSDAGVACWKSKYHYNVERPVTYIQRVIDPNWKPYLGDPTTQQTGVTPPFPAYPSGHSTFGGAASEVLTSIFGISYAMTDRCHEGETAYNGLPALSPPSIIWRLKMPNRAFHWAYTTGWTANKA